MNFVFLMDPLHKLKIKTDTSYLLMFSAAQRGHRIFYLLDGGISIKSDEVKFHVTEVTPQRDVKKPFIERRALELSQRDTDIVFIRTDPPFDETYLMNTWLLDRLPNTVPVINKPSGIRTANEKIWATQFTSLVPRTLISQKKQDLLLFLDEEQDIIAKPTGGYGGFSVFRVSKNDINALVILETLTDKWKKDIVAQQYISEAANGDKRILLLDGEPLGVIGRVHADDDHRNNISSGAHAVVCDISSRDKEIIKALQPELKRLGLYFVGIDIIGDYLIEVNVTSPTCMQEMDELYRKELAHKVIDFAEKLITQTKGNKEA